MPKQKRGPSSVFLRYALSYALVVMLLFTGITVYLYRWTRAQVRSTVVDTQINRLTRIAEQHESSISALVNTAEEIGLSPHIESFSYDDEPWKAYDLQLQLVPYTSTNAFCDQVYLHFTGDNRLYSSSACLTVEMFTSLMRYAETDPAALADLIQDVDRLTVLPVQRVESKLIDGSAPNMITFLVPLGANPSTAKGSMLFMVKESTYLDMFSDAIDDDINTYIFYGGDTLACAEDLPVSLVEAELASGSGAYAASLRRDGRDYLVVALERSGWGMRYAALLSMDNVNSAVRVRLNSQIAILLALTGLCMLIAVWIAQRHVKPIQAISNLFPDQGEQARRDELQHISSSIRRLTEHNNELISRLDSALPMQRHDFVFRFIKGRFASREEAVAAAAAVKLDIDMAHYQVILCSMPEEPDYSSEMSQPAFDTLGEVTAVGVELVALKGMLYLAFSDRADELPAFAELIRRKGSEEGRRCIAAISAPHQDFGEAPAAYLEAAAAYDNRFVSGDRKVLVYDDISFNIADILPNAQKLTASISQALTLGNRQLLDERISDMLYFLKNTSMSPFAFRIIYNDVINTLTRNRAALLSAGSNDQDIYDIFSLSSCQSIDDLDALLRRLCDTMLSTGASAEPSVTEDEEDVITQVVRYMDGHFDDPEISMAAIAESFDLTTTRLSMSFKNKKGMTPLDYLTLLRCERAKTLLEQTDWTIRDISARVGYYDSGSFIRRFKQVTGMTPLQYRRRREAEKP